MRVKVPEHSSARLERYLQLCAMGNMQVMNITTPANLFHAFRRQLKTNFRKPLVIMSPKSLLRHPLCVSTTEEFTKGGFKELMDDNYVDAKKVKRVNICTGKIYYDLLAKQQEDKRKDVAVVRLEQLYPMPETQMKALIEKYSKTLNSAGYKKSRKIWVLGCIFFDTIGLVDSKKSLEEVVLVLQLDMQPFINENKRQL